MYTDLLRSALVEFEPDHSTRGEALASVLQCRLRLDIDASRTDGREGVAAALADQLSYDLALIRLARICGLTSEPDDFEQSPQGERSRLERSLISQGIDIDELSRDEPGTAG